MLYIFKILTVSSFYGKSTKSFQNETVCEIYIYSSEKSFFFSPIFCCPGKLFTKMFITPTFSTSTGFKMAHFEAKKHEKTIESMKSNVVKGQMSVIL